MGQSPTWGRPAPEVRLEIQFMGLVGRVKIWGASPFRGRNIVSRKKSSWCVNMRAYNFLVCGPKFTKFFRPVGDEMLLIKYLSDFRYVDPFRGYLRLYSILKSKIVTNSAEFWTFFTLPNFVGGTPCKISHKVITPAMSHTPGKISWGYAHYSQSYRRAYVEF